MALAGWLSVCISGLCAVPVPVQDHAQPEVAAPAASGGQVKSDGLLKSIITDLGADDVLARIDAQRRLTDAASIRLKDIEQAARGMTLTPEQRKRLLSAAYVRFCLEPRAGMGIQSNIDIGERGLVLQAVVPGFPAAEVLRVGDRVLSVDGRSINDINMMRPVVISRDPGDEVAVVLVRAGTTLNLKVRLGRATDLNSRDRFAITPDLLDEAWLFRSESIADPMAKADPAPIESGLPDPASWQYVGTAEVTMDYNDGGDPNLDSRFKIDARRLQNPDLRDLGLIAAGEPRGAGSQIRWATGGLPNIRIGPNARVVPDGEAGAELDRMRALQVSRFRADQERMRKRIEALRGELGTANEARKAEIVEEIDRAQRRIQDLEVRLQRRVLNP